jgi:hypothetical protein
MAPKATKKAMKSMKWWRNKKRWWRLALKNPEDLFRCIDYIINFDRPDCDFLSRRIRLAIRLKRIGNKQYGVGWWTDFSSDWEMTAGLLDILS